MTVERCFAVEGGFRRAPQLFSSAALRREASAGCRDFVSCCDEPAGGAEPSCTCPGVLGSVTAWAAMPRAYSEDLAWRVVARITWMEQSVAEVCDPEHGLDVSRPYVEAVMQRFDTAKNDDSVCLREGIHAACECGW